MDNHYLCHEEEVRRACEISERLEISNIYIEASVLTYLATLDTADPDGANADTDVAARKRAATVRRGAMVETTLCWLNSDQRTFVWACLTTSKEYPRVSNTSGDLSQHGCDGWEEAASSSRGIVHTRRK